MTETQTQTPKQAPNLTAEQIAQAKESARRLLGTFSKPGLMLYRADGPERSGLEPAVFNYACKVAIIVATRRQNQATKHMLERREAYFAAIREDITKPAASPFQGLLTKIRSVATALNPLHHPHPAAPAGRSHRGSRTPG